MGRNEVLVFPTAPCIRSRRLKIIFWWTYFSKLGHRNSTGVFEKIKKNGNRTWNQLIFTCYFVWKTFSKSYWVLVKDYQVFFVWSAEAVIRRCSVVKIFLEISQNWQENTCARVSLLKRDSGTGVFLWILWNFYKNTFITEHLWKTASINVSIDVTI